MVKTGRSPYVTTDVLPYGQGETRLRPPRGLGGAETAAFVDLITSTTTAHFTASDLPLLTRWAELTVLADRAAKALASGDLVIDGKPNPLIAIHASATKGLAILALRLRLGPQSRAGRAPKTLPAGVSYYERVGLLEGKLDDEAEPS